MRLKPALTLGLAWAATWVGWAWADIPPRPVVSCESREEGDPCRQDTGQRGTCHRRTCYSGRRQPALLLVTTERLPDGGQRAQVIDAGPPPDPGYACMWCFGPGEWPPPDAGPGR